MADMTFHSEAIERLCFACGNIIMKNAHLVEPSLFQNIIEAFSSNITTVENISPRNLCHSCWRAVKHFVKKQSAILFAALQKQFVYKLYKKLSYRVEVRVCYIWLSPRYEYFCGEVQVRL